MHGAAVVALVVVLGDDLPIGGDLIRDASPDDELIQRIAVDPRGNGAELVDKFGATVGQPNEDEPTPLREREPPEAELPRLDVVYPWRGAQRSIESVRPEVIGTTDHRLEAGSRDRRRRVDQFGAAVHAPIGERPQHARAVAND